MYKRIKRWVIHWEQYAEKGVLCVGRSLKKKASNIASGALSIPKGSLRIHRPTTNQSPIDKSNDFLKPTK